MENKNNYNNSVGSGFLLGVLIGVILTLLITTKKGREILKDLMDRSMQKIMELENLAAKDNNSSLTEEENDFVKTEPEEVKKEIKVLVSEPEIKKTAKTDNGPIPGDTDQESKPSTDKKDQQISEKGGIQKKINKRLFFRRTQKTTPLPA